MTRLEPPAFGRTSTAASSRPSFNSSSSKSESTDPDSLTCSPGCLPRSSRSAEGSRSVCTLAMAPIFRVPPTTKKGRARSSSSSEVAWRATSATSNAKVVGLILRLDRSNRGLPKKASSCFICRLTALGVQPTSPAAAAKVPLSRIGEKGSECRQVHRGRGIFRKAERLGRILGGDGRRLAGGQRVAVRAWTIPAIAARATATSSSPMPECVTKRMTSALRRRAWTPRRFSSRERSCASREEVRRADVDDVRLHVRKVHQPWIDGGQALRQRACAVMVTLDHAIGILLKRHDGRRGDHARLPHASAQHPGGAPRLGHEGARAREDGPDRRAQALGQGDRRPNRSAGRPAEW